MKRLNKLFLALALCAAVLATVALAAGGGFNAKLTVDRTNEASGTITVTVEDSSVLAQHRPTLSIPCTFAYAKVTFGGQEVISAAPVNGQISFPVAAGGTYIITKTDAPTEPTETPPTETPPTETPPTETPPTETPPTETPPTETPPPASTATPRPSVPTTTTKTQKNEDGSTTRTVTNRVSGKVTATTTYPGGAKLVVETKRSGEQTIKVTVPAEKEATFRVPAEELTATTVAVIVGEDGSRRVVPLSVLGEDALKVTLDSSAKLELVDNAKTFEDVEETAWYAENVAFAASRELFQGYSETVFAPQDTMTRGMLMTVLARVDGVDTTTEDSTEQWYQIGVDWAIRQNVSDGAEPERAITREEMAEMLYRMAGAPETAGALEGFADADEVSGWAGDAMRWAVEQDILRGAGGRLYPQNSASRAEVAAILQRYISDALSK